VRPVPQAAIDLARQFEGFRATRYYDTGGKPTIGYGHLLSGPTDQLWAAILSDEEAQVLLAQDMDTRSAQPLETTFPVARILAFTEGQYAALLDFVFNEGIGHFSNSTLYTMIRGGQPYDKCGEQFGRWVYGMVNGQEVVLQDLVRRRAAETALWNS
jgi:lysozyme